MSPNLKKTTAIFTICVSSIVIILCLFIFVQTWRMRLPTTEKIQLALKETSSLLNSTIAGLDMIDELAMDVYSSTLYLDDATNALAQTVNNTDLFIDSASSFMGESLNNTITNTQVTLESAQSSARVVDNILTALSNVPLIGLDYNPEIPLSSALGEVSASLDPLQESLTGFQENLLATQSDLQIFAGQLELLEGNIQDINKNLATSQVVIEKYQEQATSLKAWVDKASVSLPKWITGTCVVISIVILLLILTQGAMMLQAINMFSSLNASEKSIKPDKNVVKDQPGIETLIQDIEVPDSIKKETGPLDTQ